MRLYNRALTQAEIQTDMNTMIAAADPALGAPAPPSAFAGLRAPPPVPDPKRPMTIARAEQLGAITPARASATPSRPRHRAERMLRDSDPLFEIPDPTARFVVDPPPPFTTEYYRYDPIGNILEKAGVLYAYSDPLHPSAVTSTSDGRFYTYDANGNMITGAGRALSWDADQRLIAVTIQGGNSAQFAYDASGGRVRKTNLTTGQVTRYPFGSYEIGPDGVITKYFTIGIEKVASKKSTGQMLFYHNDHLGGVNVITDATGLKVQLTEYDPWGKVTRNDGNADPTHRFTGKELDPETGLMYYGGRYYDPVLGRFISADPFVPRPGNPQSLNRYSYVENNPVNRIDPSGFFSFGKFFKKLFKFHQSVMRIVGPIALGITIGIVLTPFLTPVGAGIVAGMVVGAVNTALNGGDYATNILLGAALGGIGGAIAPGLGGAITRATGSAFIGAVGTGAILGGAFGGISAAIYGGDVGLGILYGAVSGAVISAAVYAGYQWATSQSEFAGQATFDPSKAGYKNPQEVTNDPFYAAAVEKYQTITGRNVSGAGVFLADIEGGFAGLQQGDNIYLSRAHFNDPHFTSVQRYVVIGHELTHVSQARIVGAGLFARLNASLNVSPGYPNNPFEFQAAHVGAEFASKMTGVQVEPHSYFKGLGPH